jgi:hypothetical protein
VIEARTFTSLASRALTTETRRGWKLGQMETPRVHRNGVLLWFVRHASTKKISLPCFYCSSRPSTKYFFPHRTLFQFICPYRPASRVGSPVFYYVSLARTLYCRSLVEVLILTTGEMQNVSSDFPNVQNSHFVLYDDCSMKIRAKKRKKIPLLLVTCSLLNGANPKPTSGRGVKFRVSIYLNEA